MRPITKIMLGIIAVGGLLQSVGFGLLLWPSREFTRFYLQQVVWLRPTMIGLTGACRFGFPLSCYWSPFSGGQPLSR
ncbi:hypothetical protein Lpp27_15268 [Lacticaseibacillus paracasei subsp. paracasei CNCM I-4648]|nr:hypothetical protein Lpp27_15268 [Lacticaseibacillus paracasei subsp. paracasei CNCM I-4648]